MTILYVVLYLLAFACFAVAAVNTSARINLVAAGLALWVLVPAVQLLDRLT